VTNIGILDFFWLSGVAFFDFQQASVGSEFTFLKDMKIEEILFCKGGMGKKSSFMEVERKLKANVDLPEKKYSI